MCCIKFETPDLEMFLTHVAVPGPEKGGREVNADGTPRVRPFLLPLRVSLWCGWGTVFAQSLRSLGDARCPMCTVSNCPSPKLTNLWFFLTGSLFFTLLLHSMFSHRFSLLFRRQQPLHAIETSFRLCFCKSIWMRTWLKVHMAHR